MVRGCPDCQMTPLVPERKEPWTVGVMPSEGAGCPTCGLSYCAPCAQARDQRCRCGATLAFGVRYSPTRKAEERLQRNLVVHSVDPADPKER